MDVSTAEAVVARLTAAADVCAAFDPALLPAGELGELLEAVQRQANRIDGAVLSWTASFDQRNGARVSGHRNTQHFLQDRLRLTPGVAKGRADTARRLAEGLDDTREALERGDISAEHAAAIVRGTDQVGSRGSTGGHGRDGGEGGTGGDEPDGGTGGDGPDGGAGDGLDDGAVGDGGVEGSLLAAARDGDASQVRRQAQRLAQQLEHEDADAGARAAYRQRHLSIRHDGATTWLEGRLHQAAGERLAARLQALAGKAGPDDDRSHGQRMADALIEACDGGTGSGGAPGSPGASGRQGSGGGVVAVVPLETIEQRAGAPAGSLLWSGPCPPSAIDEAICKAGLSWLITDPQGLPLSYGTAKRFATGPQRAVLATRDGGCRWPGCSARPLYTVAHHEPPHGEPGWGTDLDRMVLMCGFHHGLRHHGGWRVRLDPDGTVTVISPDRTTSRTETAAQARTRHGLPTRSTTKGDRHHPSGGVDAHVGDFVGAVGRTPSSGERDNGSEALTFDLDADPDLDARSPQVPDSPNNAHSDVAREARAAYDAKRRPAKRPRAGPGVRAGPGLRAGPGPRAGQS